MNNDLISREALKEEFDNLLLWKSKDIELIKEVIDNAPTVTDNSVELVQKSIELGRRVGRSEETIKSQRPQGEWLFDKENSFTIDMFKCSICGYFGDTHFKFCPDCGADMRKGGEEE